LFTQNIAAMFAIGVLLFGIARAKTRKRLDL